MAAKNNLELEFPNTQIYSRSPYYVGGQMWNKLPKITQEQKSKEIQTTDYGYYLIVKLWLELQMLSSAMQLE